MEPNWLLILLVIVAAFSLAIFLIWKNQKDKKELMRKIINEDHGSNPPEHDTEADQTED
jgi:preprotein translocase subunit YajC